MPRILYVDDDDDIREVAVMSLELDPDFEVRACVSGSEMLQRPTGSRSPKRRKPSPPVT